MDRENRKKKIQEDGIYLKGKKTRDGKLKNFPTMGTKKSWQNTK